MGGFPHLAFFFLVRLWVPYLLRGWLGHKLNTIAMGQLSANTVMPHNSAFTKLASFVNESLVSTPQGLVTAPPSTAHFVVQGSGGLHPTAFAQGNAVTDVVPPISSLC